MVKNRDNIPSCPGAAIGMRMLVTLEGIGTFNSTLIGMEYGQCLIVKSPMIPEFPVKFFQQNYFVVRYIYAGGAYGFRTTLVSMIKEPVRLFVLNYPDKVESLNLRKDDRYDCLIPAVAKMLRADDPTPLEWQGTINDISATGCCFEYVIPDGVKPADVTVGDILDFSINFPNENTTWTLNAEVRSLNINQQKLIFGLKYKPNPDFFPQQEALNEIQAYIEKIKN